MRVSLIAVVALSLGGSFASASFAPRRHLLSQTCIDANDAQQAKMEKAISNEFNFGNAKYLM